MGKLIKNEIKKIILSKKYMVVMAVLLFLYVGITFLVCRDVMKATPEASLNRSKEYVQYLNKEKQDKNISKERKNEIEYKLKEIEYRNKNLQFEIKNRDMDWHKKLKKENELLQEKIKSSNSKECDRQLPQYIQRLKLNEYYLKNNIKPTENYEINAFNIMSKVNVIFYMLIAALIIAVITSDSVSGEFNPATIKLLVTKPVSRQKILFSKFVSSIIVCALSFIILKLIVFLVIGVILSFGNYKEPIAFYTKYINDEELIAKVGFGVKPDINSIKIYSLLKFILLSGGFSLLFIITCVSINLLISTITKKNANSLGMSVILAVVTSIISMSQLRGGKNPIIHSIAPYLFSTYSSGEYIVAGQVTEFLGVFVNNHFAILVLLVWTVVCYGMTNFIFTKKDIM
ncbi:ABC transporter permease subunit [Haloimpatiens sp. FM7330]|uniref:ABC transporter permease subunit n=1 Tax=Haloimpatiens sp. FM7330 TaxID=3298610 RepID=UPI003630B8D4